MTYSICKMTKDIHKNTTIKYSDSNNIEENLDKIKCLIDDTAYDYLVNSLREKTKEINDIIFTYHMLHDNHKDTKVSITSDVRSDILFKIEVSRTDSL